MKKAFVLALLVGNVAQAQIWTVDGPFKDEFMGCSRISTGQVQCAMKSSYIGNGPTYIGATYFATDSAAYAPDNKRYIASRSSINGRDVSRSEVNVSKSAPVMVVYTFDYPRNFDRIALLFIDTGMLKQVPIKSDGAITSPAAAPQSQTVSSAPKAQSTVPLNAFDIKLTGCTQNAQGDYSCKQADLIPRR
ncbi:hypothetical protein [Deinococcus sp.]|uniref:hypothetical protein n=1 Tax=Deinococcus sp. TaxID=47478 RepID=UPI0025BEFA9B|nr:hypothetical protein [Deinococcus sp.]